jgi:Mn-dependent DtxR family transcriptional regulator
MHMLIKALTKVASKYAPSRGLSFGIVHIFKTMQLIERNGHVGRGLLCKELGLGEGSIKTLIKHLKMNNLVRTSNHGTMMTERGRAMYLELTRSIP